MMADERKPKKSDDSRPTESSLGENVREPGDIVDQAQRDDPNNYIPGNSAKRSGNAA
jgi:hypothetical protein